MVTPTLRYLDSAARLLADAIDQRDSLLVDVGLRGLRVAADLARLETR